MAILRSGMRVPIGRITTAGGNRAIRVGPVAMRTHGGTVGKATMASVAGFKQGIQGRPLRISKKVPPLMSGKVARGHIHGRNTRIIAMKSGAMVKSGAIRAWNIELGTLGGAAVFAAGGYGAAQMIERQHAKKALTAKQLHQRRMAAKRPRNRTSGVKSGSRV